jgi:hypothetical protein
MSNLVTLDGVFFHFWFNNHRDALRNIGKKIKDTICGEPTDEPSKFDIGDPFFLGLSFCQILGSLFQNLWSLFAKYWDSLLPTLGLSFAKYWAQPGSPGYLMSHMN